MVDYSRDLVLSATTVKGFLDLYGITYNSINAASTRVFEKMLGIENCFVVETNNGNLLFEELFVFEVGDVDILTDKKMNALYSKRWRVYAVDALLQMDASLKEVGEENANLVEQYKAKFFKAKESAVQIAEKEFDEAAARLNDLQNLEF